MRLLRLQVRAQGFRGQGLRPGILRRGIAALAGLAAAVPLAYLLAAALGGAIPNGAPPADHAPQVEVLLIPGPIHYDFLLPLSGTTRAAFSGLRDNGFPLAAPQARWLVVGWGARGFYTATERYGDLEPGAVMQAILGDAPVMRVDLAGDLPPDLPVQPVAMSKTQYADLLRAIRASFASDAPLPAAGFTDTDAFYPANGRFSAGRTSNAWVGEMLGMAGLRFGLWTPAPFSVRLSHWLYQQG